MPTGRRVLPIALLLALTAAAPAAAAPILGPETTFPASSPHTVVLGDLDGDGHPDLVTADPIGEQLDVLLGNGDGTFRAPHAYPTATMNVHEIAVADLDGDGHQDVVVTAGTNGYGVLLGNGDGTLRPIALSSSTFAVDHPLLADFDGDNHPDLMTSNVGAEKWSFQAGNGAGGFASPVLYVVSAIVNSIDWSVTTDFDGNGTPDLAFTSPANNEVLTFANSGGANYGYGETLPTGGRPTQIAAGDLDGDGRPDLVTADNVSGTISVLRNNPASPGRFLTATDYPAGAGPGAVKLAGIDPAALDAVVSGDDGVVVLSGNGDGTFGAPVTYDGGEKDDVAVGDLDGDGAADLVAVDGNSVQVRMSIATIDPDATSLGFGTVEAGTTGDTHVVTVSNHGGAPLVLSGATVGGADAGDFTVTANTCTAPVAAGASCAVTLRFAPAAAGARSASLDLAGNAASGRSIALSGTATAAPVPPVTTPTETTSAPTAVTPPPAAPAPAPAPVATPKPLLLGLTTSFSGSAGSRLHGASCPGHMAATARVNLSVAATVRLTAKAHGKTVASLKQSLPAGRSTLTVCLTRAGQRLITRKHTPLKATATLTIAATGFTPTTRTLPLRFTYRR